MPVKVKCSGCETVLNAPDRARGKAVKCPKCGTAVKVPAGDAAPVKREGAPAKKKPATVASGDSSEFFASLDVSRIEDRTTRVCPKCGAIVGAEDVDCPMCGADLVTGGMGTKQRARAGRKGAAPSEYYGTALRDAGKYLGKKQALAWKSFAIYAIFGTLALFAWLMVAWCHNVPPQAFWIFVASVITLMIPGWGWIVQNQLVRRALNTKEEKYPVRFEPFIAVSLGVKAVFWSLIFGFPCWVLFGMPALLIGLDSPAGLTLLAIAVGTFVPIALVCWPVAQTHFVMPITWPGWAVHKVVPDVLKNIGPSLYWVTFTLLTALPMAGLAAGAWLVAGPKLQSHVDTLVVNSGIRADKQAVELEDVKRGNVASDAQKENAKRELLEEDWLLPLWAAGAIAAISLPAGFWTVYNARSAALFSKLFKANIANLLQHEKEYKYVAKTQEERDAEAAKANQPQATWGGVAVMLFLGAALGSAGGLIYASFGENVGYVYGWGTGLWWGGVVLGALARFGIIGMAFQEDTMWGLGCVWVPFVLDIYSIKNWAETKYLYVMSWAAFFLITIPGFGLQVMGVVAEAV